MRRALLSPLLLTAACALRVDPAGPDAGARDAVTDAADVSTLPACLASRVVDVRAVGERMPNHTRVALPADAFARGVASPPGCGAAGRPTAFLRYTAPAQGWLDLVGVTGDVWALPACDGASPATCLSTTENARAGSTRSHRAPLREGETLYLALAVDDPAAGAVVRLVFAQEEAREGDFCAYDELPRPVRCEGGTSCTRPTDVRQSARCVREGTHLGRCRVGAAPCDEGFGCGLGGRCLPLRALGEVCDADQHCAAGICSGARVPFRCIEDGAHLGRCRAQEPRCDEGASCLGGRCLLDEEVGRCGGAASPARCTAEEACALDLAGGGERVCRPRGAEGTPCSAEAPCRAGLRCAATTGLPSYVCRVPRASGATCDRRLEVCAEDHACAPDGATERCLPLGASGAPCSERLGCLPGARCGLPEVARCLPVVAEGAPCGATLARCGPWHVCDASGRCAHANARCAAGERHGLATDRCVVARGPGEACDDQALLDACDHGGRCRAGRCPPVGAEGAPCRASSVPCDDGLECGAGGVCFLRIDRSDCINGRGNDCWPYVGARCGRRTLMEPYRCNRVGTLGGDCLQRPGVEGRCEAGLRCVGGSCVATAPPGGACGTLASELPFVCPAGERCVTSGSFVGRCTPG